MSVLSEFRISSYSYNRSRPSLWILSHLFKYPLLPLWVIFASLASLLFQGFVPVFIGRAFDYISSSGSDPSRIVFFSLVVLGSGLLSGLFLISSNFAIEFLAQRIERDSREELYASLLGKSLTFHDKQRVGDIMARAANDVQFMNLMVNPGMALVFRSFLGFVFPLLFIYFIAPPLVVIPVLYAFVFVFLLRRYNAKLSPLASSLRRQFGVINSRLNEVFTGIHIVRAFSQESYERDVFFKNVKTYRDVFVEQSKVQAKYIPLLVISIVITLGFLHGLFLFRLGVISFGDLIAFLGLLALLRFPTFINIFAFSLLSMGFASARRILNVINAVSEIDHNPTGVQKEILGEVRFEHVSFGYDPEKLVLFDVSFLVKPGQTVALVGMTGSGKTTLTKLVARLYDVHSGRVLIDGIDVRDWNLESLRSQMGVVEQDVFLFSKSIRENILFGNPSASDADVIRVAKIAQAHDFIMELPDGYDTVIGERGVTLSGGQRQRIAIARAILSDPRILILDDASSAIDSKTEDEIQKAIRNVLKGRTTFLITHRIAQIRHADLIVLLKRGRVLAVGRHEELLREAPLYRRIFAQFDDELPSTSV